jgi:WD40 repeat protein
MGDELKIDDYKLSQELSGHSSDVRVVGTSNDLILSGSRDKTVRVWQKTENGLENSF